MMEVNETESFYQIKSDKYQSCDFIVESMLNLGGSHIFIEFLNTINENIGLTFETINEATEWIAKGFWVDICVTVRR